MGVPILLLNVALPVESVVVVIHCPHLEGAISQKPHMEEIPEAGRVEEAFHLPAMHPGMSVKYATSPVMMLWTATIALITHSSVTLQVTALHRCISHLSILRPIQHGIRTLARLTT
jgi:hypothetical protein